jgi:hypothetical protein
MGPGVRCDLVTFSDHTLDDSTPLLVNSTLADVDTSDKESGLETSGVEFVQDLVSVDVWAVVVGDSNGSWLKAAVDAGTAVLNTAQLRASIIASAGTSRSLVGITTRSIIEEAIRSVAVLGSVSTVSL